MFIHSGSVITQNKILPDHSVEINDQWIQSISSKKTIPADEISIDAYGCFISPGWIDLHTPEQ